MQCLGASGTDPSAVRRPFLVYALVVSSTAWERSASIRYTVTEWCLCNNLYQASWWLLVILLTTNVCVDSHPRVSTFNLEKCQTLCYFGFRYLGCWEEDEHVKLLQLHRGNVVSVVFFSLGVIPDLLQECEAWRVMQLLCFTVAFPLKPHLSWSTGWSSPKMKYCDLRKRIPLEWKHTAHLLTCHVLRAMPQWLLSVLHLLSGYDRLCIYVACWWMRAVSLSLPSLYEVSPTCSSVPWISGVVTCQTEVLLLSMKKSCWQHDEVLKFYCSVQ